MINENALQCLVDRGYSQDLITENLQIPGSKFYDYFATDIKSLLLQCATIKETASFRQNGYLHISYEFEPFKFPEGIGTVGVISLEALKSLTSNQPVLKKNRGHLLLHAAVSKLPITNLLTLVLKEQQTSNFLITAFPGSAALPLPSTKFSAEFNETCKLFWEQQVFLSLT
ncbi:MAG: hypothetical protein NTY72_13115 [Bacteroidetes bacterium]|nr:hypothetical protein [Bacteroidota bacterium]